MNPITKEGYAQLSEELAHLKGSERPKIIQAIAEARAHGDLSENAEYHSAKEKQGFIEARIKLLEDVLSTSTVFDPESVGVTDRCIFGAYVDLKDPNGTTATYRLVSEFESNVDQNKISSSSPIGKSLMGKELGDTITVSTPEGDKQFEILAIRYS